MILLTSSERFLSFDFPTAPVAILGEWTQLKDAVHVWLRHILPSGIFNPIAFPERQQSIKPIPAEIMERIDIDFSKAAAHDQLKLRGAGAEGKIEEVLASYFRKPRRFNPAKGLIEPGYSDVHVSGSSLESWLKTIERTEPELVSYPVYQQAVPQLLPPEGYVRLDEAFTQFLHHKIGKPPSTDNGKTPELMDYLKRQDELADLFWSKCVERYQSLRIVTPKELVRSLAKDTLTGMGEVVLGGVANLLFYRFIPLSLEGDLHTYAGGIICIPRDVIDEWTRSPADNASNDPPLPSDTMLQWAISHIDANAPSGNRTTEIDELELIRKTYPDHDIGRDKYRKARKSAASKSQHLSWLNRGPKRKSNRH